MGIYSVFNIPVRKRVAAGVDLESAADAEGESVEAVGAFVTGQSLVSFTGATAVINTIWVSVGMFVQLEGVARNLTGLVISLLIGMCIYAINVTDPQVTIGRRDRVIAFGIAFINSLMLFVASFGVQAAVTGAAGGGQ